MHCSNCLGVHYDGFSQDWGGKSGDKERKERDILEERSVKTWRRWNYLLTVHSTLSSNFFVVNRIGLIMLSSFLTVQTLVRDCQVIRETKENQIAELKKICEQSAESLNNDWEKKVRYIK